MKINFLLILISTVILTSCSTVYRNGQTPDDVYASSARVEENVVITKYKQQPEYRYYDFEEREIRMATYDRRWRNLNYDYDYDYYYNPYKYGYSYGYYYNPYYYPGPVFTTGLAISNPKNTTPRMTNLGAYTNTQTFVSNSKFGSTITNKPINNYNNNNNTNRRINYSREYNNTNTYRTTTTETNTRSYTPTNNSSTNTNSSSSGSSSSGGVSRPARGN